MSTHDDHGAQDARKGLYASIAARLLWGGTAWYLARSRTPDAFELFHQRLLWAFAFCLALCAATGRLKGIGRYIDGRRALLVNASAALVISTNWLTVFWCVKNGHVASASLGFFLAPMLTIMLGLALREEAFHTRLVGPIALCLLGIGMIFAPKGGGLGWPVVLIAATSAVYALIRRRHPAEPLSGNLFETGAALIAWTACAMLMGRSVNAAGGGADGVLYAMGIGVVTTVPMWLYVYSLKRVALSLNAYLQYISPTIMFLLSLTIFRETLDPLKLAGFALIWASVALHLWNSHAHRAAKRERAGGAVAKEAQA